MKETDKKYMELAHKMATFSEDPNTKVGSVIVNRNTTLSCGFNHFPNKVPKGSFSWQRKGKFENTKYAYVIHAEADAILDSKLPLPSGDNTLYTTMFPCNECAKLIVKVGINRVVYHDDKYNHIPAWIASKRLLDLAKVEITKI